VQALALQPQVARLAIRVAAEAAAAFVSMPQPSQPSPQNLLAMAALAEAARITATEAAAAEEGQSFLGLEARLQHHLALEVVAAARLSRQIPTPQVIGRRLELAVQAQLALSSSRTSAKENKCATPS
jgi:hypothetical protein